VLRSWKSRAIPLPTLWATTGPVTGTFTFYKDKQFFFVDMTFLQKMRW